MKIKYTGMELKLHRHGILIALASVFGAMLIATPLAGDSGLANGIVMGKVFWFHLSMALMAIGTAATAWFGGRKGIYRVRGVVGKHGVLWDPEQAAWSGRRRVGVSGVRCIVLSVAVAVVLGGTSVFGGDQRDGRQHAGTIIRLVCFIRVSYYYNQPVVACLRLPVHLAERAI